MGQVWRVVANLMAVGYYEDVRSEGVESKEHDLHEDTTYLERSVAPDRLDVGLHSGVLGASWPAEAMAFPQAPVNEG